MAKIRVKKHQISRQFLGQCPSVCKHKCLYWSQNCLFCSNSFLQTDGLKIVVFHDVNCFLRHPLLHDVNWLSHFSLNSPCTGQKLFDCKDSLAVINIRHPLLFKVNEYCENWPNWMKKCKQSNFRKKAHLFTLYLFHFYRCLTGPANYKEPSQFESLYSSELIQFCL